MSVDQPTEIAVAKPATAPDLTLDFTSEQPPERQPPRKVKSRVVLNFWLDAALLVCVVFIAWVSAHLYVAFPAPTQAAGWTLWGLTFDQWHNLQSTALCICGLLALEHLVLHWNWVCNTLAARILRTRSRPDEGLQAVYGVGTFIGILLLILGSLTSAVLCVKPPPPKPTANKVNTKLFAKYAASLPPSPADLEPPVTRP